MISSLPLNENILYDPVMPSTEFIHNYLLEEF